MKYSKFFKTFPHKIKKHSFSQIAIIYSDIDFFVNVKTLEITLGFRPYDYNLKPWTLTSLTKQFKSKFGLVDKNTIYVQAPQFRWLSYRFYLDEIKDLNQVINILNPCLLLGKLSS